jgi:hypothetical protein
MSGSSFDAIAQAILKQHQVMEKLKEENRELQRQLAELRAGHGIFVEIGGQQIALSQLIEDAEVPPTPSTENSLPEAVPVIKTEPDIAPAVVAAPTAVPIAATESLQPTDPRTRTPNFPEAVPVTPARQEDEQKTPSASNEQKTPSSFLEEMMIDEFSSAMTSPMAVWTGPAKQAEITDEEKKAALRKELMGSFLLE